MANKRNKKSNTKRLLKLTMWALGVPKEKRFTNLGEYEKQYPFRRMKLDPERIVHTIICRNGWKQNFYSMCIDESKMQELLEDPHEFCANLMCNSQKTLACPSFGKLQEQLKKYNFTDNQITKIQASWY